MKIELWVGDELRESRQFHPNIPAVDDLIEMKDAEGLYPYRVVKLYKHFSLDGDLTLRADLQYAGPPSYMF